ncbi:MAG: CDP-glucose 4,6-dehydratase, partial [Chloroflexota bacterium]|nr:CDP-glucose 4,6-dehydratase [Chloroflexota bacterium]
ASKGAAEVIFHGYASSFFENDDVRLATARAGNVIGGGDWSKDRIVVDCMTRWARHELVEIRSPSATRPWQHVLEPLSGYLMLGAALNARRDLHGEAFNFGPRSEVPITVEQLLWDLAKSWGQGSFDCNYSVTDNIPFNEAGLLKLNCDKALFRLGWEANLTYQECVEFVGGWYLEYFKGQRDMRDLTRDQIKKYEGMAISRGLKWTI